MRALTLLFAGFLACATRPPESNRMKPDHAPTPYSAQEIQQACPAGRISIYLIESPDDLAQPSMFQTFHFKGGDEKHAKFTISMKGADGKAMGPARTASTPWTGFQAHASFPAADTVISEDSVRTPAGRFDCWLYTVTSEKEGRISVKRLHFARDLPGPPVRMTDEVDGRLASTMTLVEHTVGG